MSDIVVGTPRVVEPDALYSRLGAPIGEAFCESLVSVATSLESGWCDCDVLLGTADLPDGVELATVAARVELCERFDGSIVGPVDVRRTFKCEAPEEDVATVDWAAMIENCSVVVERAYQEFIPACDKSRAPLQLATYEAGFVPSIRGLGIVSQACVLNRVLFLMAFAACGLLSEVRGAKLHPVRANEAGDAEQVKRADGAKLWRCMVSKRGAGYRLHYWSLPDGSVEFGRITVESEIYEG